MGPNIRVIPGQQAWVLPNLMPFAQDPTLSAPEPTLLQLGSHSLQRIGNGRSTCYTARFSRNISGIWRV